MATEQNSPPVSIASMPDFAKINYRFPAVFLPKQKPKMQQTEP